MPSSRTHACSLSCSALSCTHVHTHVCVFPHAPRNTRVNTLSHTCTHSSMCILSYSFTNLTLTYSRVTTHVHTHPCTFPHTPQTLLTLTHANTLTYEHTHMHTLTYVHSFTLPHHTVSSHTHSCMNTLSHIHAHTRTHSCTLSRGSQFVTIHVQAVVIRPHSEFLLTLPGSWNAWAYC